MIAFTQQFNLDVAEEEKLEAEREKREEAKRKKWEAEAPSMYAGLCRNRIPNKEYEALESIYSQIGLNVGNVYRNKRVIIRDRRVVDIYLEGHALAKVPEEVGKLAQLERLILSNNQLNALPDFIADFKSLRMLVLDHNLLKSLPGCLESIDALKWIEAQNNPLDGKAKQMLERMKKRNLWIRY
jgi:Leucine-rich repeat (LRR) protein